MYVSDNFKCKLLDLAAADQAAKLAADQAKKLEQEKKGLFISNLQR